MKEKGFNNIFKFSLYQENILLCEKILNGDDFNPLTRSSIDIRPILHIIIIKLQKVLSKKQYETLFQDDFDLFQYYLEMVHRYSKEKRNDIFYSPKIKTMNFDNRIFSGVECKLGLYINDKTIVERNFYVDNYNIVARWSFDLVDEVVNSANMIYEHIKKNDVKNMWDEYNMINVKGFTIDQIRAFPLNVRKSILRDIYNKH